MLFTPNGDLQQKRRTVRMPRNREMSKMSNTFKLSYLGGLVVLLLFGALPMFAFDRAWGSESVSPPAEDLDWSKERQFWAFRRPLGQPQPVVRNRRWPRQRLDYFILARLEQ